MGQFWKNKKVLVTGGAGFIGSHVVEKLVARGAKVTILDNLQNGSKENLQSIRNDIVLIKGDCMDPAIAIRACRGKDIVMNLAARVGGIEYNRTHQAVMLKDNLCIATSMIEAAIKADVERFLVVSSACVYSKNCSIPTPEAEGFLGEPESTNGGYGWAKRMAEKLGEYYADEYGIKVGIVRPYNCYGPRDHFSVDTSHVVPALIKRILDGNNPLTVWGSGKQSRAFLYVEDLAEGMILSIEKYPLPDPINFGTDEEITIKQLVGMICDAANVSPKIRYDSTKPDGSPRRNSDNKKAQKILEFFPRIDLHTGLSKTIEWYKRRKGVM